MGSILTLLQARHDRHETEKATRYIAQLDEARCNGRWNDVPELARKIEKHAPQRRCLTLTARSEVQVAAHSVKRPSTADSSTNLSKIIPSLLTAIEEETDHPQDAFQANICLGWLHFALDEPGLAVARLPKDFAATVSNLSNTSALSGWTEACIIKGAYLRGFSQERTASIPDAVNTYSSVLSYLSSFAALGSTSPQLKIWTERLLGRLCMISDQSTESGRCVNSTDALQFFRFWAKFWESSKGSMGSGSPDTARYRRLIWKAYYDTLSAVLEEGLPYIPAAEHLETGTISPSEKLSTDKQLHMRLRQRAELKSVETLYESLLLKETDFPRSGEKTEDIEAWVEAVMANWRVLCGPTWRDEDLGEGGKGAVGRGVLDILYRAATKTFHSTQILRHLFTVHASLAEFDLAFKAYDSYAEIVTRSKDREEKSGEEVEGLDDDSTILRTAAEGIRILCRFGSRPEAEKARDMGNNIEKWLKQNTPSIALLNPTPTDKDIAKDSEEPTKFTVAPRALAVAYRAIGISQAHWARATFDADTRTSIQSQAVHYLRKSLEPRFQDPNSIESFYALGLALAEMRDISGAIKVVKRALSPLTKQDSSISTDGVISDQASLPRTEYARERKLIPLWHLLALLLTARSDFATAAKSCEAAFEQFGDPAILFGPGEDNKTYRSDHLNTLSFGPDEKSRGSSSAVVDRMETFEKSGIVQIKLTQLALIETMEGPNAAVDASDELLALYARLFGDPGAQHNKLQAPSTAVPPPKSSAGTVRNSIFRSRTSRKNAEKEMAARNSSIASSRPSTVATQVNPPTIEVTNEDSPDHARGHSHDQHFSEHGQRPTPKRSSSKLQKRSANSLRRRSETDDWAESEMPEIASANGTPGRNSSVRNKSPRRPSMSSSVRKSVENHDRPLRPIAHNMPHKAEPPPSGHPRQPPRQDTRLPSSISGSSHISPDPRFSVLQERRHKISLLIKIWLFISGLYTRADMLEDAGGAVKEAMKLVQSLEMEVAQESSSSKAFAEQGWGGGKSVEELWGNAWAAQGELQIAQSKPHNARSDFEKALSHFPDHANAVVGLSNILLDTYCKTIPLEPQQVQCFLPSLSPSTPTTIATTETNVKRAHLTSHTPSSENQISPPELHRLAARDRAFGLLSSLTKLGAGWDYSEAWFALARAYEEGGQINKAKEVLWWCVELEDTQPVRNWRNVAVGGFVL